MLQPIDTSDFSRAAHLLHEGFPLLHMSGRCLQSSYEFWMDGLDRIRRYADNREAGMPYGQFLIEGGEAVGILLTLASLRADRDGAIRRHVNLSSWYIRPEHRWRSPLMLQAAMKDRDAIYTDLTPTKQVQRILPALGMKPLNYGIGIEPLLLRAWMPARRSRLRPLASGAPLPPGSPPADMIETHRELGCMPLILSTPTVESLLILKRSTVRGLPAAIIVYADNHALLCQHIGAVARCLIRQGILFLEVECRHEDCTRSRFFRARSIRFATSGCFEDRIDYLGSELCILNV